MIKRLKQITFSIKLTVISLFILLSVLMMAIALSLQYYFSQSLAKESADILFQSTAQRVSDKIHSLDVECGDLALLLSQYTDVAHQDSPSPLRPITHVMAQAMLEKPYLYAIYIGFKNGNFYELVNLESSAHLKQTLKARPTDRWLIIHIYDTPSGRQREFRYYNEQFSQTHQRSESSRYYVTERPWYRDALKSTNVIKTEPYIFHNPQSPGITYAKRITNSNNVIAVDISLTTLSTYLQNSRLLEDSQTLIFDKTGKIYAHTFHIDEDKHLAPVRKIPLSHDEQQYLNQLGVLRVSNERNWPPFDFSYTGEPQGYSIDLLHLISKKLGLKLEYSNGYNWDELVDLFQHNQLDILHSAFQMPERDTWGLFSQPYLTLSPILVTRSDQPTITTLAQVKPDQTVAIPEGWAFVSLVRSHYPHINILEVNDSLSALKAVIDGQAQAAFDNQMVVEYFVDRYLLTGLTLHVNHDELVNQIDQQLRLIVHHDQPELQALLNKAIASLSAEEINAINTKWLGHGAPARMQRTIRSGIVPSPEFLTLAENSHDGDASATDVVIGDVRYTVYVHHIHLKRGSGGYIGIMVPTHKLQAPYLAKVRYSLLISLGLLVLITPFLLIFSNMIVTPVKLLAEENDKIKRRQFSAVKYIPTRIREINDLSNSMLSMSDAIQQHQRDQQELIDAFIKIIAQAIDDKSPYTGAHCARVPELAIMLAESAEQSELPAFKTFRFATDDQRREFTIAAWLHDCGKVTTPEHIIDKGSKLETIYNRIHEIRMRFEVLWRDAEIAFWQDLAEGGASDELKVTLSIKQQQIQDDFAFIAQCNLGKNSMSDADQARLKTLAKQTWIRHLDNRLGLSPYELKRCESTPPRALPIAEPLLKDSPADIIPWTRTPHHKGNDSIKMTIPDHQSNLGEIYNLSIRQGTLTAEDRYRINEHIIFTIHMLEALPLPEELSRVPEIAGGHHEKLDGTGYPKRLDATNLSLEARILAIADVFEALTAADRPYKEAKTLSQSIEILAKMAKERHLDQDVFKLLLSSNVYQRYAERFLKEEQCDEVDVSKYL